MKAVIIAAIALGSFAAQAKLSSVQETTTIKCQDLRAKIRNNGWLYLTVNGQPKAPHYTVYVANASDCSDDAVQAWVPTLDGKNCPAAFVCVDND